MRLTPRRLNRIHSWIFEARVRRDAAQATLPLMLLSFMSESRRLDNARMKTELRLRLRYPQVLDGLVQKA